MHRDASEFDHIQQMMVTDYDAVGIARDSNLSSFG